MTVGGIRSSRAFRNESGSARVAIIVIAVYVVGFLALLVAPPVIEQLECDADASRLTAVRPRITADLKPASGRPVSLELEKLCDSGDTAILEGRVVAPVAISAFAARLERRGWHLDKDKLTGWGRRPERHLVKRYEGTLVDLFITEMRQADFEISINLREE